MIVSSELLAFFKPNVYCAQFPLNLLSCRTASSKYHRVVSIYKIKVIKGELEFLILTNYRIYCNLQRRLVVSLLQC